MADIDKVGNQWKSNDGRLHDNYADAQHSNFQDSQVQDAVNIMTGGGTGKSAAERQADGAALYKILVEMQIPRVKALVKNYNNGKWFAVAHSRANPFFYEEVNGVRAIAYGKLGNYKKAFKFLLALENGSVSYIGRDKKIPPLIDQNIGNKEKLTELALEAAKEAVSKHLGHMATEDEFTKYYLSACERRIRAVPRMVNHDKAEHEMYGMEDIWKRLAKKEMTLKDKKRIARGSGPLTAYFFGYRNRFVSFLVGLIVGFGSAVGIDWICVNYLGLNGAFFPALFVFIICTPYFWRHRTNFIFLLMLVLSIFGYLALLGVLPNENLLLFNFINAIKDILAE